MGHHKVAYSRSVKHTMFQKPCGLKRQKLSHGIRLRPNAPLGLLPRNASAKVPDEKPLRQDYIASLSLLRINHQFAGQAVIIPRIGAIA